MSRTRTGRRQGGDKCCEALRFREVLPFSSPEWNVSSVESGRSICNIHFIAIMMHVYENHSLLHHNFQYLPEGITYNHNYRRNLRMIQRLRIRAFNCANRPCQKTPESNYSIFAFTSLGICNED
jgi:hypothetical protein